MISCCKSFISYMNELYLPIKWNIVVATRLVFNNQFNFLFNVGQVTTWFVEHYGMEHSTLLLRLSIYHLPMLKHSTAVLCFQKQYHLWYFENQLNHFLFEDIVYNTLLQYMDFYYCSTFSKYIIDFSFKLS